MSEEESSESKNFIEENKNDFKEIKCIKFMSTFNIALNQASKSYSGSLQIHRTNNILDTAFECLKKGNKPLIVLCNSGPGPFKYSEGRMIEMCNRTNIRLCESKIRSFFPFSGCSGILLKNVSFFKGSRNGQWYSKIIKINIAIVSCIKDVEFDEDNFFVDKEKQTLFESKLNTVFNIGQIIDADTIIMEKLLISENVDISNQFITKELDKFNGFYKEVYYLL